MMGFALVHRKRKSKSIFINFKGHAQFMFCVAPKNHWLMFVSWNIKKHSHKKVIVCFFNLGEELLKVAAVVIFPTSIMVLFEIYQRFKGHFLNELRVSFNDLW